MGDQAHGGGGSSLGEHVREGVGSLAAAPDRAPELRWIAYQDPSLGIDQGDLGDAPRGFDQDTELHETKR